MSSVATKKIRVMMVDDERITRMFLRDLIESEGKMEVVREAVNGDQAIEMLEAMAPGEIENSIDAILLDLGYNTDGTSGIETGPRIRKLTPTTPILVLSQHDTYYEECRSWASGYMIKEEAPERLHTVVREMVEEDQFFVSREVMAASDKNPGRLAKNGLDKLTAVERRVLVLTAQGMSSAEAARNMDRSVYTINNHLVRIYNKLKIPPERRNKPELARLAVEARLIPKAR